MVSLTYDLHIHSCLSPCGDDDMTPANIAGMAAVKGLDVIALTDHNACRNCPAFMAAAEEYGVLAIPGMEITTSEEVHAVCLFPTLEAALNFDRYVYERLMKYPNNSQIFGRQQIYNLQDQAEAEEENLLINSTDISFDHLWDLVSSYGGVMIPASRFVTAEVKDLKNLHRLRKENPYLETCKIISNSDAHYLEDIHEPELTIQVSEKSIQGVLEALGTR